LLWAPLDLGLMGRWLVGTTGRAGFRCATLTEAQQALRLSSPRNTAASLGREWNGVYGRIFEAMRTNQSICADKPNGFLISARRNGFLKSILSKPRMQHTNQEVTHWSSKFQLPLTAVNLRPENF
jgi:hypothetical protein